VKTRPQTVNRTGRMFRNTAWESCYQQFLGHIPSSYTRHQYDYLLRRFFTFVEERTGSKKTPDKITREDIEAFLLLPVPRGSRKGMPIAPTSRNCYLITFKSYFDWCGEYMIEFRGKIVPILRGHKPTDGMQLTKVDASDRDMEEGDIPRFLAAIDRSTVHGKRDYALFLALLVTGRRRAEIVKLRWGDFEQKNFFEHGQEHQGWLYRYTGKTNTTPLEAEMPQEIMDAIRDYREAKGDWGQMRPSDPVFASPMTNEPLHLNFVSTRFKRYVKKAGLAENVVLHSLRHENAWQRYQENGHDVLKVQEDIGWKSAEQAIHYIQRRKRKLAGDSTASALARKFARF